MLTLHSARFSIVATGLVLASTPQAAEVVRLDARNFSQVAPAGKEVDAIEGDIVLRNDRLVVVLGAPGPRRHANLTVKNVGGCVIDLTARDEQNDQLSAFYPLGGAVVLDREAEWSESLPKGDGAAIAFSGTGPGGVEARVGYELRDGEAFVRVTSTVRNGGDKPAEVRLADGFRCDGEFVFGFDESRDLWWAHDVHWRQAYGLQPEGADRCVVVLPAADPRTPRGVGFPLRGSSDATMELAPNESVSFGRRLFPAADGLAVKAIAARQRGEQLVPARVSLVDGAGPVAGARVELFDGDTSVGVAVTAESGMAEFAASPGSYRMVFNAQGYAETSINCALEASPVDGAEPAVVELAHTLPEPGYVEAAITDATGAKVAAKVEFTGLGETPSPNWGPESAEFGVGPVRYTANGAFRGKLLPGRYRYLASHGPEYDAASGELEVTSGQTEKLELRLARSVDTTGWLSAELHSHSTPSGDNTASQLGRVLNLLAEHLEFAPCTEHQRLDVYDGCLQELGASRRMLTCPGMELTGQPLPLNHQNAFPLVHKPRTQDGGGPETDTNPVDQIKRLAGWDNNAPKYVQSNHPNVAQMVGDRDLDGSPDGGFEPMFGFMDAVEIHPPGLIFTPLGGADGGVGRGGWEDRGNVVTNWLQLLNLGYRVTGVVNTDAHYNLHGSGWLRNWVRSTSDDPAEASVAELVHEFEHGHVVVSNGPFLAVEARAVENGNVSKTPVAIPGDDLSAPRGGARLRVVVRCPNWLEVNRVQLFLNGRPLPEHNYTARSHSEWFGSGNETFDRELDVSLDVDTHVVVAVCGEGRQLGAVYGATQGKEMPVAIANPVFIDLDGDADGDGAPFEANKDGLGLPLPVEPGLEPSHGHTHHNHTHE
ncbi:MAG: CehA/McbA family metallohydrolase [Lacipirellulaceae bacterium]